MVTYAMTFLYALHYAIPLYATSSYLHIYFNSLTISILYALGSLFAIFISLRIAKSIKQFHTYPFAFAITIGEILAIALFGLTKNTFLLPILFILHFILQTLLYVCLNIFIESFSAHAKIGSIRGLFLAILNLGILISPMIGGFLLSLFSFTTLYLVAASLLIPYLYFLHHYLKHIKEPAYHQVHIFQAFKKVFKNKNLRAAAVAEFVVSAFYAVMIIYSPLYLTTLGIPLAVYMGIILPLALVPLVVLPYELGLLADRKFGEKEMLILGTVMLTVSVFLFVITSTKDIRVWIGILLLSRIGVSFAETMAFSYYFKKVDSEDPSLTALFVNMQGVATVIVTSVGILIAPFLTNRPQLIFVILGCGILYSISYMLPMKDTR